MVSKSEVTSNLFKILLLFQSLDVFQAENQFLEQASIKKRSLDEMDTEDFASDSLIHEVFEPAPKVSGLLKRVKRFGCWHSCIGPPKPYIKQQTCVDGNQCSCLLDLLGKIHGIACLTNGRSPLASNSERKRRMPSEDGGSTVEKKLQCNYKTCWTIEEGGGTGIDRRKRGNNLDEADDNVIGNDGAGGSSTSVHKLASVVEGVYLQGKCNCGQEGSLNSDDVHPSALNHVHQREDYKFALSFKTFPNADGKCVCRFGKQINDPSPGGAKSLSNSDESESQSSETSGVRTLKEMQTMKNDESRDIIQCGLNGCHHILMKLPKHVHGHPEDKQSNEPWYLLEMKKTRTKEKHIHETAATVQCNLKTCWKVEDGKENEIQQPPSETRTDETDALDDAVQLTTQQKLKLLSQRGKITPQSKSGIHVQCSQGVCAWYKDESNIGKTKTKNNRHRFSKNNEEIVVGKDGLCPCYKAYLTYYNWKPK